MRSQTSHSYRKLSVKFEQWLYKINKQDGIAPITQKTEIKMKKKRKLVE